MHQCRFASNHLAADQNCWPPTPISEDDDGSIAFQFFRRVQRVAQGVDGVLLIPAAKVVDT